MPGVSAVEDHFRGTLLGVMVGDALGMPVEGWPASAIRTLFGRLQEMEEARLGAGRATDDTHMTVALAEALLETPGKMDLDRVAARFAAHFDPARGYGANASRILAAIRAGEPWQLAARRYLLPGGSFGNGAAMRVAPVALAFFPDSRRVAREAEAQAAVSGHTHPEGRFGARLMALAIVRLLERALAGEAVDPQTFLSELTPGAPGRFPEALRWVGEHLECPPWQAIRRLGTGVRASSSVPIAIWAFLSCREDPEEALLRAVNLGGDSDTIGSMTGALAGAFHGHSRLPSRWLEALEEGPLGRSHLRRLADRLTPSSGTLSGRTSKVEDSRA